MCICYLSFYSLYKLNGTCTCTWYKCIYNSILSIIQSNSKYPIKRRCFLALFDNYWKSSYIRGVKRTISHCPQVYGFTTVYLSAKCNIVFNFFLREVRVILFTYCLGQSFSDSTTTGHLMTFDPVVPKDPYQAHCVSQTQVVRIQDFLRVCTICFCFGTFI